MNTDETQVLNGGSQGAVADCKIFQCDRCLRLFNADGSRRSEKFMACVPEIFVCAESDCAEVAGELRRLDRERSQRSAANLSAWRAKHLGPKRGGKSAARKCDERLAESLKTAEAQWRRGDFRSSCPPERDDFVMPMPSEDEFQASGKAASADDRLIEFFKHQIAHDGVGKWFSRVLLKKLCGNDYINNRIVNARAHFEPLGWTIQNADVSPDGIQPMSSHYRILAKQ